MSKPLAAPLEHVCHTLVRGSLRALPDRELLDRFVGGDDAAFTALVDRHGALVLGACRRVLSECHLAEDAFQATFVALAKAARSHHRPEALAGWLFAVARRRAAKVGRREQRLRRRDRKAAQQRRKAEEPRPWDDLLQVLDEELQRLPERWRAPLVSCYLQGRTQDEAARELGWPLITLRRRLAAGRDRLKLRLERRGATLSAGLLAAALAPAADAASPAGLSERTAELARAALNGTGLPASISQVLRGGLAAAEMGRAKLWLGTLIAASVLIGGGVIWPWAAGPHAAPPPEPGQPAKAPPARDRFNDALPDGAVARLGTIAFRHRGEVTALAFHPDGKSLYSVGRGAVSEWNLADGQERIHFGDGKTDYGRFEAVSVVTRKLVVVAPPDPQNLGKRGEHPTVCTVWDLSTQKMINQFDIVVPDKDKSGNPRRYYLSPDGGTLVVSDIGHLWLWDTANGRVKNHIREEHHLPTALAFAPDGKRIISGDQEHVIRVWDLAALNRKQFGGGGEQVADIAVSPDGKRIAVRSGKYEFKGNTGWFASNPLVRIWDIEKAEEVTSIDTSQELGDVNHVALMPDGSMIVVGHKRGSYLSNVCHYHVTGDKKARDWACGMPNVQSMALSADGKTLALGTHSGNVRLFDTAAAKEGGPSDVHHDMVWMLEYSTDGKQVVSAADDEVRRWDPKTGQSLSVFRSPQLSPEHCSIAGGGRFVLKVHSADNKHRLRLWDMAKKSYRDVGEYSGALGGVALAPDGKRFAVNLFSETEQSLQVRDSVSGEQLWEIKLPREIIGVPQFSRDGGRLLLNAQPLKGFDAATGKELFHWDLFEKGILPKGATPNCMLEESPDGKLLAFGVQGHGIALVDAGTGKLQRWIETNGDVPWPLKFSPDGKSLASSNAWNDSVIRIWDVATGEKRREFTGARNRVLEFAFSPDGRCLASGGYDGTILIWELAEK
jgi:RNA polymerase sigma factor (sigma-70 family)